MSVASPGGAAAPLDRRGRTIDVRPIAPILARVVQRWNPLQIWLFGSRARGDAGIDSDWDLLAIVPDCPEPADFDDPMTVWRVKRQPDVPSDLIDQSDLRPVYARLRAEQAPRKAGAKPSLLASRRTSASKRRRG